MAAAANADDYAAARQNIWFTANNSTPADGNLTGQCVTLDKWFFNDMIPGFPAPFAARGNAKDMGNTLVAQGLAVEVPFSDRRRGDIICYEYGAYGHTAVQLSGGRVFESNVNWSGVATRVIGGETVHASRIGNENEAWRVGKNAHVYRLKGYNEGGNTDMITNSDTAQVRIIMSEVEGWDMNDIHSGKDDGIIMGYWVGRSWLEFIMDSWSGQPTHRGHLTQQIADLTNQINQLGQRPTDADLQAAKDAAAALQQSVVDANKVAADSKAKYDQLAAQGVADQQTGNSFLRWLGNRLNGLKGK